MISRILQSDTLWYTMLATAFLAITIYASKNAILAQREIETEKSQQAKENLSSIVEVWEAGVRSRVDSWLDEIAFTENVRGLENRYRRATPWFDAIYIWEVGLEDMTFPENLATSKTILDPNHPCLTITSKENFFQCSDGDTRQQNQLAVQLGNRLLQQDKATLAQELNNLFSPPLLTSLSDSMTQQVYPVDLLQRKLIAWKAEQAGAPPQNAIALLRSVAKELPLLSASTLKPILPIVIASFPHRLQTETDMVSNLSRAQRRISAYEEIKSRMLPLHISQNSELYVRSDPYGDRPYLLMYKRQGMSDRYLAVQLDPVDLIKEIFPAKSLGATRPVILDINGRPLMDQFKEMNEQEEIWVQTSCGSLFPHLQAALVRNKQIPTLWDRRSIPLFLPILIAAAIAGFAILGRMSADRRQKEFVERQQAFIARVTHELKTPIAGIRLMAESLKLGVVRSPEQAGQFTDRILSETNRLEARIDEVLQASRRAELKTRSLIDGGILLKELYQEWSSRFSEVGGILRLELDEDAEFFGDRMLVRDAIANLLGNAIKYRSAERSLRTIVMVESFAAYVEFSVSDNGLGVPFTHRRRIFERFVRIEGPNRGLSGGYGLGLAFVAETIEAHKGSFKCTDGINGGAKFILRFPLK